MAIFQAITYRQALLPQRPIVVSIPHSGEDIPNHIAQNCTNHHLSTLRNTDWHLDKLFSFLPELGITVIKANFSRYVIDVNRPLTSPPLGPYQKCPIYQTNTWGEPIYKTLPTEKECKKRIEQCYFVYHKTLEQTLETIRKQFGQVTLLDLHSFMGPIENDICLGECNGQANAKTVLPIFKTAFEQQGYDVAINKVFTGGHITRHYGTMPNTEALQIEIRYTTYLKTDQLDLDKKPDWEVPELGRARKIMREVFEKVVKHYESIC